MVFRKPFVPSSIVNFLRSHVKVESTNTDTQSYRQYSHAEQLIDVDDVDDDVDDDDHDDDDDDDDDDDSIW